ncbi:MAG: IS1380 family transposase [Candidatus Eisenbacteria bacterium]|uniref:IS1380 family transposase n=1 Tax=Eiseniibacteriota bacterium TaxID=2212470 RepID=A0A538TFI6_UNCEI|nr:MAG: IS1380 family transposase [Candidatus Eisenbacteria bacterium]
MKIPRRFRRVKFHPAAQHTTSFAGLRFVFDLAAKLGVIRDLKTLTVKKRRRGIPIEDFVMGVAANFVVGGDSLSDLQVLRDETVTRELCYGVEVPAATTAGERLRTFALGHLYQLERINRRATRAVLDRIGGSGPMTVDLDSSIFEVYGYLKEGARYGYTGERGLHPLLAFVHAERLLLGARLRAGNRASADGVASFLPQVLKALPDHRTVRLRMDAGFYAQGVERLCVARGLGFSISAKLTSRLQAAIGALPASSWQSYPWEEGAEWAEFRYRPNGWSREYRLLVKRAAWFEKDQRVIGEHFHTAVLTNLSGAGSSLIRYHLARGGMENYIEEFKHGVGAAHLPSQNFHANWAWLLIAALAYNLAQGFKLLLLNRAQHADQLKKLRLHWFNVGARWIRTGRRWILALARGPDTVAAFSRVQSLLAAL